MTQSGSGASEPGTGSGQSRRFGASRVRPRVQISRTPLPPHEPTPPETPPSEPYRAEPAEMPIFGRPREFAGGRIRVFGCSPGCLLASVGISLLLSWLLTALVN